MTTSFRFSDVVGQHPCAPHPLGIHLSATDQQTEDGLPHRALSPNNEDLGELTRAISGWLLTHHRSSDAAERDRKRREALVKLGLPNRIRRFPSNPSTQKGNWAEVVLAEYIAGACPAQIPVYRLRYNPNVDQSMKGDDVLAFDLDSQPIRIVVGEAKFRATPSKQVVEEIVECLTKSVQVGIPISLPFVADRLFEQGQDELGAKVQECSILFAQGSLRIDHVGLLASGADAATHVQRSAKSVNRRLALISLNLLNPEAMVTDCFSGLIMP